MEFQLVATSLFTCHRKEVTHNCSPVLSPSKTLQLDFKTLIFTGTVTNHGKHVHELGMKLKAVFCRTTFCGGRITCDTAEAST